MRFSNKTYINKKNYGTGFVNIRELGQGLGTVILHTIMPVLESRL